MIMTDKVILKSTAQDSLWLSNKSFKNEVGIYLVRTPKFITSIYFCIMFYRSILDSKVRMVSVFLFLSLC